MLLKEYKIKCDAMQEINLVAGLVDKYTYNTNNQNDFIYSSVASIVSV
jgi:hypothetical protein